MFSFTCFTKVHWVHSHIMKSPKLCNWMNKFRVPSILNEFSPKNGQFFGTENHRNQGAACPERSRCTLRQHAWNWAHHEGWKVPDWLIQGGLGCGFDISTKWLAFCGFIWYWYRHSIWGCTLKLTKVQKKTPTVFHVSEAFLFMENLFLINQVWSGSSYIELLDLIFICKTW